VQQKDVVQQRADASASANGKKTQKSTGSSGRQNKSAPKPVADTGQRSGQNKKGSGNTDTFTSNKFEALGSGDPDQMECEEGTRSDRGSRQRSRSPIIPP
jgi:hypothetical protein